MSNLLQRLGGVRGILIRLRLTTAYSVTSLAACVLLSFMLLPVIEITSAELLTTRRTLLVVLAFDLVCQTLYNEHILSSILQFLRERKVGKPSLELTRKATSDFLSLPRKIALVCLVFWTFTVVSLCASLWFFESTAWPKLLYVFATTMTAAIIATIFQYSLFRRIMAPIGTILVRYGEGLNALREGFQIGTRARLLSTFLLLVFAALSLSGLMGYGQFVKLAGEQAAVLASAALVNITADLPEDRSEWPAFVESRQLLEGDRMALWDVAESKLIGTLPVSFERIKPRLGKSSGSFEDAESMSRISYHTAKGIVVIAVVTPHNFLRGSIDIVWATMLILTITFLFLSIIFTLVARDIVAPFTLLRRYMTDMAQGKIDEAPMIVTEDELGRLDSALRAMGGGLRTMFTDLKVSLENVKRIRQEIAANLREIQSRSADQDRNVDRSFMSFNELNSALRDITENVVVVDQAARESRDAAHDMGRYLDDIRAELSELVDTVRGSSRFIFSMVENVEQSTHGVTVLHQNLLRLRAQIDEIQSAFLRLSREMERVIESSGQASTLATSAIDVTASTNDGVGVVKDATEQLLGDLQQFREGILRIAGVVAIISDVTEQTALLAFNAAILAAQSQDDHAKDFAVVGDEIKDLAERTESSTKDVGSRMNAINEKANRSLDEMREALGLIQQGQLLTVLANDSVRTIHDHSFRNDKDSRTISEGIYYQNHNLVEILKAVSDELFRIDNLQGFTLQNGRDATSLRTGLDQLHEFIKRMQATTTEQGEGSRHIVKVVDRISEGVSTMRRDLRKLSGGSGEVVLLMNEIRMTSHRNSEQTDEMGSQLKRLDALLKSVEIKLAAVTVS